MHRMNHRQLIVRIKRIGYLVPALALFITLVSIGAPSRTIRVQAQTPVPEATSAVFSNTTPISLNGPGGPANGSPYASPVFVSGLAGNIPNVFGAVKVTIKNFSHEFSGDVGFVLVGPTGAALMLQNNIGIGTVTNATYTLSDVNCTLD